MNQITYMFIHENEFQNFFSKMAICSLGHVSDKKNIENTIWLSMINAYKLSTSSINAIQFQY